VKEITEGLETQSIVQGANFLASKLNLENTEDNETKIEEKNEEKDELKDEEKVEQVDSELPRRKIVRETLVSTKDYVVAWWQADKKTEDQKETGNESKVEKTKTEVNGNEEQPKEGNEEEEKEGNEESRWSRFGFWRKQEGTESEAKVESSK